MSDVRRIEIQEKSIDLIDRIEFLKAQNYPLEVSEPLSRIAELGSTIALNYNDLDKDTIDKTSSLLDLGMSIFDRKVSSDMIENLENLTTSIELLLESKKILLRGSKKRKQVA